MITYEYRNIVESTCCRELGAITCCSKVISQCADKYIAPILIKCTSLQGDHDTYVRVFGYRRKVAICFKDQLINIQKATELAEYVWRYCEGVTSTKLIFARPLLGAVNGAKLMVKIYLRDNESSHIKNIRKFLETSIGITNFTSYIHNAAMTQASQFRRSRFVNALGTMSIQDDSGHLYLHTDGITYIHDVYYKDVHFHTGQEIPNIKLPSEFLQNLANIVQCKAVLNCNLHKWKWSDVKERALKSAYVEQKPQSSLSDIKIYYDMRENLRRYWFECLTLVDEELSFFVDTSITAVYNKSKWLVFDIETNYEKHKKKPEEITAISGIVYDHVDRRPLNVTVFSWLSAYRQKNCDYNQENMLNSVRRIISENYSYEDVADLVHIEMSYSERDMIDNFLKFVRQSRCTYIAHFNGNSFDLPLLNARFHHLNRTGKNFFMRDYSQITLPLTNVGYEVGNVKFYKNEEIDKQSVLIRARQIRCISFQNITNVDIMLHTAENKARGEKLEVVAAARHLHKLDNDDVSYDNLFKTWYQGNLDVLLAYVLIDSLLLKAIETTSQIGFYYLHQSQEFGRMTREIHNQQTMQNSSIMIMKYTIDNILSYDPVYVHRDNSFMNDPKYVYEEKDFERKPQLGATTVQNAGLYNILFAAHDMSSQYPSIIRERNYCMTTLLDKETIVAKKLEKDVDYEVHEVPNVHEQHVHINKHNRKIVTKIPQQITQTVYVSKKTYYEGILPRTAQRLYEKRCNIREKETTCLLEINRCADEQHAIELELQADTYKANQTAVKTSGNAMYGAGSKISPILGGLITNSAREQIRSLAMLAKERFHFLTVTGDTDSIYITLSDQYKTVYDIKSVMTLLDVQHPSLSAIMDAVIKRMTAFAEYANATIFKQPCHVVFERVFASGVIYAKKNYTGIAVDPQTKKTKMIQKGITGLKANTSKLKSAVQQISTLFLVHKSIDSFIDFACDIYRTFAPEIQAHEKVFSDLQNDPDPTTVYNSRNTLLDKYGGGLVDQTLLESYEKVGDMDAKNKTMQTKAAILLCNAQGISRERAPRCIGLIRNVKVQFGTFLLKACRVLLEAYETETDRRERYTHIANSFGKDLLHKIKTRENSLNNAVDNDVISCRQRTTQLPTKYIASTLRTQITKEQRLKLVLLAYDIENNSFNTLALSDSQRDRLIQLVEKRVHAYDCLPPFEQYVDIALSGYTLPKTITYAGEIINLLHHRSISEDIAVTFISNDTLSMRGVDSNDEDVCIVSGDNQTVHKECVKSKTHIIKRASYASSTTVPYLFTSFDGVDTFIANKLSYDKKKMDMYVTIIPIKVMNEINKCLKHDKDALITVSVNASKVYINDILHTDTDCTLSFEHTFKATKLRGVIAPRGFSAYKFNLIVSSLILTDTIAFRPITI